MSNEVTGTVVNVVNGKTFVGKYGALKNQNVKIKTAEGKEITVQRSVKEENTGSSITGKAVHVVYDPTEVTSKDGKSFTVNKTDSKRFTVLDAITPSTGSMTTSSSSANTTSSVGSAVKMINHSEGARNGMIVNNAVQLAGLRKTLDLKGLLDASDDIKKLTDHVENGGKSLQTEATKTSQQESSKKTKKVDVPELGNDDNDDDDDDSPFKD